MIKILCMSGAVVVASVLAAPVVMAADDLDCSDFASPVVISDGYDPLNLDADGDGIGCESNPGEPVKTDLYADLRGSEELADTGAGDMIQRHPLRAYGAAGLLVIGGTATIIVVRLRTRIEGE